MTTERIRPVTGENIRDAADIIRSGGLVAFPTETVYGLGANALDTSAIARVFAAKGRPMDNPLILHVASIKEVMKYGEMNQCAEVLMHQFWPGPLSIILYSMEEVPEITRGGLETVALRMPSNFAALSLIRKSGLPIAAPSANHSGRPSPTTAQSVAFDLAGEVDMILDDGPTVIGLESTVVDATRGNSITILRPGAVTREELEKVVDVVEEEDADEEEIFYRSPGTRHRHYAPRLPVVLWDGGDALFPLPGDGHRWCYIGLRRPPEGAVLEKIFGSTEEYAHLLYESLRELEMCGAQVIIAELPEDAGLGAALRNRLERASGI